MRKLCLAGLCMAILVACGQQNNHQPTASAVASAVLDMQSVGVDSVVVETARGQASVPKNPERIAVYDFGMLDTLDALGVPIGATVDRSRLAYLAPVVDKAEHVGTLFEPDYEALNRYQPQLIITGSRTAKAFDQLSQLAPTIEMTADTKNMLHSAKERIDAFALIFNKQTEAEQLKKEIDQSFADAKAAVAGKGNGLVILVNGGKMSAFGPDSRLGGWLHRDIGVPAVDQSIKEGSHGQPISFEYIKQHNPDWLFVLDRSAAIGAEGEAAQNVLNNPLVAETTAWKKGQVVYLDAGTYLAAGGARQLQMAANQVKEAFLQANGRE